MVSQFFISMLALASTTLALPQQHSVYTNKPSIHKVLSNDNHNGQPGIHKILRHDNRNTQPSVHHLFPLETPYNDPTYLADSNHNTQPVFPKILITRDSQKICNDMHLPSTSTFVEGVIGICHLWFHPNEEIEPRDSVWVRHKTPLKGHATLPLHDGTSQNWLYKIEVGYNGSDDEIEEDECQTKFQWIVLNGTLGETYCEVQETGEWLFMGGFARTSQKEHGFTNYRVERMTGEPFGS
ncbi:hypothetical protein GQ43DRAFT_202810 [Delitschia confertaspora ATCC 74209]|uniref:Ubiquitin 3 binding protein But2 C-terminal domain-containing protein n=1 Tax=Delitschia confertaspora ATCC 74209 TaxID=1513339 RepID=A0A9P4JDP4_9PLEO|nr:hypothetical protein GQ43DRAFT_202810 [Delitschia confertaspora ATCC 74209]